MSQYGTRQNLKSLELVDPGDLNTTSPPKMRRTQNNICEAHSRHVLG